MQSITINITAKDWMTNTTSATLNTIVLKSGDKDAWAKLIGGKYGAAMKAGVLEIVAGATFTKVFAGKEKSFCKNKRTIEIHFTANK